MEPRNNVGPKDWQNMFAITRFRYINGLFSNVLLLTGAKKKIVKGGLVSEETVVLRRWGSETRKFGLSTELINVN